MGLVLGLALITKQSAIILAPVAFLAVLEQSRSAGNFCEGASRGAAQRHLVSSLSSLSALLAFGVTTALVSGWWYARNWRLYGDLFGLAAFQAEFITQSFDATSAAAWIAALAQLHGSFWARFGWMNVAPPGWVIWFFTLLNLLRWLVFFSDGRRKTKDERRTTKVGSFVVRLRPSSLEMVADSGAAAAGVWLGGQLRADGRAGSMAGAAAVSRAAGTGDPAGRRN